MLAGLAPLGHSAVIQMDLATVQGDQSRELLGDGKGVIVGIVDGGVNATHPALLGSMIAAKDFTGSRNTSDNSATVGHGTGIMSLILGHDAGNGFTGLAPGAKFVNAKVVDKFDNTTDNLLANGIFWAIGKGAKVINISQGNTVAQPDLNKLNMILDYCTEKYGTVFVVAAGNENTSAVTYAPGGEYNSFTVGATYGTNFNNVTIFSNYALPADLRTKPDLVAPGQGVTMAVSNWATTGVAYTDQAAGTSFSAPIVGGIVTQMMGYGRAHHLSVDPLVLKSIIEASATHISDFEGTAWTPRHQLATASGTTIDQPLDAEQGAGQIDGVGTYTLYTHKASSSVPVANWVLSSLRDNGSYSMRLGNLRAGDELDTALTWLRHISKSGGGLSYSNKYSQAATLADFSLTLLLNGRKIVTSNSNWDNLDYLSLTVPQSGNYSLLVNRLPGSGESIEHFGLAAHVLAGVSSAVAHSQSLKSPMGTFASTGSSRSFNSSLATVPEPNGAWITFAAMLIVLLGRRQSALTS